MNERTNRRRHHMYNMYQYHFHHRHHNHYTTIINEKHHQQQQQYSFKGMCQLNVTRMKTISNTYTQNNSHTVLLERSLLQVICISEKRKTNKSSVYYIVRKHT